MKFSPSLLIATLAGLAAGVLMTILLRNSIEAPTEASSSTKGKKEPLYWVAPMDPNYKRDKPGKSPMGMDLIPVYEEDSQSEGAGTVTIAPHIVNSLGVRTAKVEMRSLREEIKTVGYIQYDENKLLHIHPRVAGWIETLHIKAEGDPVKEGDPLYDLYSPDLVNAQEELLIALQRNNASLIKASIARLRALQFPESAIAELRKKRKVNTHVRFYAPQSGVLDELNIREGMYVKPGDTLLSIGDLSTVWVEGELFERQANAVSVGDHVIMTLDYHPGKQWTGRINYIYPTVDPTTRTVKVRVQFENPARHLKPNMYAQMLITPASDGQVLAVPREAVIRTGEQDRVVLALDEGNFKSVAVTLGRKTRDYIEILNGLSEGEKIVVSAQFLIDSESSKTSDFMRMSKIKNGSAQVWVGATINRAMPDKRLINVEHEAIDEWDWPAMTMDFKVAESVDMSELIPGTQLHLQISKTDGNDYQVTGTHIMSHQVQSATVNGEVIAIDHEQGTATILRGPIEKWGRAAATIEFSSDPAELVHSLKVGQTLRFTFEIRGQNFVITEIHEAADAADRNGGMSYPDSH